MTNKFLTRKENAILIVTILFFILGFLILANPTITGYTVENISFTLPVEENLTENIIINETIENFNETLDFGTEAIKYGSGDVGGTNNPISPANNSRPYTRSVNFTYNLTIDGVHNSSSLTDYAVGNYWFEQNSTDMSGNGNDGTIVGGVTNTTGIVGYAYEFDGDGDNIDLTANVANFASLSEGTISVWFKWATEDRGTIISISDDDDGSSEYELGVDGTTKKVGILARENAANQFRVSKDTLVNDNLWHHIALTVSSTGNAFYLDGSSAGSTYATGDATSHIFYSDISGLDSMHIGANDDSTAGLQWYFNGAIDEVLIFNRSLSALEINELYNRTLNVANRSLLLKIDDGNYHTNTTDYVFDVSDIVSENQTGDQTFNVSFSTDEYEIYWKIASRMWNDSSQHNSSEFYLLFNRLVTQSAPNIGAHTFVDPNYVVGSWRFEENGSGAIDETGLNNGSFVGDVKWCPDQGDSQKWNCSGRIGKGVHFDGVGDYINVADQNSLDITDFTFATWVKFNSQSGAMTLVSKNDYNTGNPYVTIRHDQTGYIQTNIWVSGTTYDSLVGNALSWNNEQWYLVAVTYDTSTKTANFYRDGSSVGTDTTTSIAGINNNNLQIGRQGTAAYVNGTLDEVTIWNRSLSSEEVLQLWNSSADAYNTAYTIQDISASNNNTGDLDNDTIKFIYDWYVNNESMAVLNMPFEAVNNGSEMNFSKDYSDNENHGSTSFNSNVFEPGSGWNRTGGHDGFGAYEFDGDGDYVSVGDLGNYSEVSITFWMKGNDVAENTEDHGLVSSDGWEEGVFHIPVRNSVIDIYLHAGGTERGRLTSSTLMDNTWYHVVVTGDVVSDEIYLYLNGILDDYNDTFTVDTDFKLISQIIGAEETDSLSRYFDGTIDEVLIFNRSLSAEQIKELYNNRTQTIKSQETVKRQYWKAEVTANDGYGDSIEYNTSELWIDDVTLIVSNQAPINYYNSSTSSVNFTYNISDGDSTAGVRNCSLWLLKAGSWQRNLTKTDYIPGDETNLTFNITIQDISLNWTIGCWDKDNEQTNSTEGVIRFQRNELVTQSAPNIGAHAFVDRNYVVGQWRFEQFGSGAGGVFDETGKNNGTVNGGVRWCPDWGDSAKWNCSGRVGKGVSFDGVGDYITASASASLNGTGNTITIAAWIKIDVYGIDILVIKGDSSAHPVPFELVLDAAGNLDFYQSQGGGFVTQILGANAIPLNTWTHVVATNDGSNAYTYINGAQDGTDNSPATAVDLDNENLAIGGDDFGASPFDGTLDEVTIWNRSLSAEEVSQLYYSSAESYNSTYTIQDISASNNNTGDLDNDTIKFIYDWYVNNESMAVLNMPFEAVNNGSEMNFSKDYSDNENHGSTNFNSDVYESGSGWNRTGGVDGFGAYEFDGAGDYLLIPYDTSIEFGTGTMSISFWVKTTDSTSYPIWKYDLSAATNPYYGFLIGASAIGFYVRDSGGTQSNVIGTTDVTDNVWHHVVGVRDTGNTVVRIYVDGAEDNTAVVDTTGSTNNGDPLQIGAYVRGANYFVGTIDEVLIFNRSLSAEQIKELYNNRTQTIKSSETVKGQYWKAEVTANDGYGNSIEYNTSELWIDDVTLIVSNQAPINYYNSSTSSVNFTYNISDGDSTAGIKNCSLWLYKLGSWQRNLTKNDYIPGDETNLTFNITIQDISLNWTIGCYDKDNEQTNSSSYNLTVDTTVPTIYFGSSNNEPYEPLNGSTTSKTTIDFIFNASIDSGIIDNCSLMLDIDGVWSMNETIYPRYINQSDGFNITFTDSPWGITTNGSDFWIVDNELDLLHHMIYDGVGWINDSDTVIDLGAAGCESGIGVTTNGSDFWVTDSADDVLYHFSADGTNMTDRIGPLGSLCSAGNLVATGVTMDAFVLADGGSPTNFWVTSNQYNKIYHFYGSGTSWTCNTTQIPYSNFVGTPGGADGLVTNGTDLWLVLDGYEILQHTNYIGTNYSDSLINLTIITGGKTNLGMTTNFTDFWVVEYSGKYVSHIKKTDDNFLDGINQTIPVTFNPTAQEIAWKIGCYDSANTQFNTSRFNFTITADITEPIVDLQFPNNNTNWTTPYINFTYNVTDTTLDVDSCILWLQKAGVWELNFTDISITETINQTINLTVDDQNMLWRVECSDINNNKANSTTYNITIDTTVPNVDSLAPINYYNSSTSSVNFTYNVTDITSNPKNCSLHLFKNGIWSINKSDSVIEEGINNTINITIEDRSLNWTIQCEDDAGNKANSSSYNLTIDAVPAIVNLQSPANESISTDGIISHIYNVSDNIAINNCSLFTKLSSSDDWSTVEDTDTSITQVVNQSINITYTTSKTIDWKIGCYNILDRQGNSTTRQLTIQLPSAAVVEAPEVTKRSTSSGTGKSEDRTGSEITETTETVTGNVYTIDELVPGETILEITNPNLAIIKVILDSSREAENIKIEVEESRNIKLEKPGKRVYIYAEISSNLFESAVNKITIIFRVQKDWGDNVKLLRYNNYWYELETNKINEDEYYEYFEAISPGFSTFAIATDRSIVIEKIKEEIQKIAEVIVDKPTQKEIWIYAYLPIIIIILTSLILLYFLIKLTRRHKKLTFEISLLGIILAVLIIPFTNEILYWAVLPLSIIITTIFITIFTTYIITKKSITQQIQEPIQKVKKKLKKIIKKKVIKERVYKPLESYPEPVLSQPQIYQQIQKPKSKKPEINPQIIINKYILRFNKLLQYISIDISQNKLDLANKRYKELLQIYKFLTKEVDRNNQLKLYKAITRSYTILRQAIELAQFRKNLKP